MNNRQTGRTTKQMQEAPHQATFVWCNGLLNYPYRLAAKIGRGDLRIITPNDAHRGDRLYGVTDIVVDHAAWLILSDEARDRINFILSLKAQ